jgi:23S rRNA pseudouridine1911/1915/1917 synthase
MRKIKVNSKDAGMRLDIFLAKNLNLSRTKIQKFILNEQILLNSKKAKPSYIITANDLIDFFSQKNSKNLKEEKLPKIPVIFEDKDVLVINKPRGIVVHPDKKYMNNTVVNWAIKHYPPIIKIGEDLTRPGIVHRLDKETSGVMILAKTQAMFEWLKKAFHNRLIKKEYLALVNGVFPENIKFIDLDIGRSPKKARQVAIAPDRAKQKSIKTRPAKTEFKIIKKFKNYTLLQARPLSGRTHQIRVHLASTGHPVAGDKIYGKKQFNNLKSDAMFLHSQTLSVPFPDRTFHQWSAPIPDDLKIILHKLDS